MNPLCIWSHVSSFHGLNHLTNTNKVWAVSWAGILFSNILFTSYLVYVIKHRFQQNQIFTTIDSRCRVNQVPFPAVAICNENMVALSETANIEKILFQYGKTKEEINKFFSSLPILLYYDFVKDSSGVDDFRDILGILRNHFFNLDTVMEEVHQKCSKLLRYCTFNRKMKNCNKIFNLVKTIVGYCCVFNYAALNDVSEVPPVNAGSQEDINNDKDSNGLIVTSESGRMSGLTVLFDVETSDYPEYSTATFYGAKILVFDPIDYPESLVYSKQVDIGESVDLKVEPTLHKSEVSIQRLSVEERGCWFEHEVKLVHSDRYTHDTCSTECRMKNYLDFCGCLPFKYPRESTSRICEFTDIPCLKNLTANGMYNYNCSCYFQCNDRSYTIRSNELPFLVRDYPSHIRRNINESEMISLKVYFSRPFSKCYVKKVFMGFDSLIATFGGIICLTMGGSIPAVFEVLYLLVSSVLAIVTHGVTPSARQKYMGFDVWYVAVAYASLGGLFGLCTGGSLLSVVELLYYTVDVILLVVYNWLDYLDQKQKTLHFFCN